MLVIGAGLSAWRGYQQLSLRKLTGRHGTLRAAFRSDDEPLVKTALLRDSIGTFTSIVGLAALALYQALDHVPFDALGALAAAALMTAASLMLMAQARALNTGRWLPKSTVKRLRRTIQSTPGVDAVICLAAVYGGTSAVIVDVDLDLAEDLDTTQIEVLLDLLEEQIRTVLSETQRVTANLNSPRQPRN